MTELIFIVLQFFIITILFLFPITPYVNDRYLGKYNFDIYNVFCINIIINLNCYLIISIFITEIKTLFLINLTIASVALLISIKKNLIILKSSNWKLLLLFFLINMAFFISLAENPKLNWDGLKVWLPKASTYYQGLGFTDVGTHAYPHLGGFLWGYFWKNSLIDKEYIGRFFYIFFYVISIFSLISFFKGNKKISLPIIIGFLIFILSLTYDSFLFGGYQDVLLFSILLIISKFLYLIIFERQKDFYVYSVYFLGSFICLWIKQEGIIYFSILTLTLIIFENDYKKKIFFTLFSLILISIYFLLKNYLIGAIQFDQEINLEKIKLLDLILFKNVLFAFLTNFLVAIIKYPIWLLIILFFLISIFSKKKNLNIRYIYLFFILNLLFIVCIIFYSCLNLGFDNCSLIMRVSMDRIMYQSSGFYLIWIIYIFNDLNFFSRNRFHLF
tara:strand:- start:602 stop:1933 length:1332 start_codon:yes stop_codon:yes gene_type:complete